MPPAAFPDIQILDLPRGDAYQGDPHLYEDILTKALRNAE
jgi:hypothetical protein